jgi:iron(III) transport system permease protein
MSSATGSGVPGTLQTTELSSVRTTVFDRFATSSAGRVLAMAALIALLLFLAAYPLAMLFYGSLFTAQPGLPGTFDLGGYARLFTARNFSILLNTVGIAAVTTAISITMAVLLAWILARTDTPMRGLLEVLITLPFFIPPFLTAMAWGMLGNTQIGAINLAWRWLTGSDGTIINVYSYFGIIWHMGQYSTVFLFLFIVDAFRAMDPSLEESSRMSGANAWQTFTRVTFMLLLPVITACALLSFIRGVEAFEPALFFGLPAGIDVVTTEIYKAITQNARPDYQLATAMSFVVLFLMSLLILFRFRLLRGRSFQTVTGKGYNPRIVQLGPFKWVTFGFCILFFLVTVVLPVGQLFVGSLFKFFGFYQWNMLTFEHYLAVFRNGELWRAVRNTAFLALSGATATMVLGSIVAYVSIRTSWRGRRLIELLAWLPWMMPGIVLGLGFLWAFAMLPGPIPIYGTIWALFLAYIALGTPIAVRIMAGAYGQLSYDIEECSRVHGANFWQTLWRILIALTWPAFVVGWVLTFFGIMRELSASILLYSVGNEVLSVVMLRMWTDGKLEQVCVIGLMMMLLVIAFRWIQHKLLSRRAASLG